MPVVNPTLMRDILSGTTVPSLFPGETLILKRENVQLSVKSESFGKLSGSGDLFLSNSRIIFCCKSSRNPSTLGAYEIPLSEIAHESFEQPIFGANYIRGDARTPGTMNPPDTWKLVFLNGGCGTLLPVLDQLLTRVRASVSGNANTAIICVDPSNVVGYIDPSDPSVVYIPESRLLKTGDK
jgi:hypothetical protein